jgi:hypothetical protein
MRLRISDAAMPLGYVGASGFRAKQAAQLQVHLCRCGIHK